jgi:SSS family solute:Na+ symporter
MIAVGLAAMHKGGYELPQKPIEDKNFAETIVAVQAAKKYAPELAAFQQDPTKELGDDAKAALKAIGKAAGTDFNPARLVPIVVEEADKPLSDSVLQMRIRGATENDYDHVILSLLQKYCPPGLLGLALTALLASFMSGMAGNVTAFNTVWTYDLYQAYMAPNKSDAHYMWMGRMVTVIGILLSIAAAYFASHYTNAMDVIQLVFGFVNAPLFATFLLGMFWARTTGTGAFYGLLGGISTSALFHGLTMAEGKGGWLGANLFTFPSSMAQNFWLASFAFVVCFSLTLAISLATQRTKTNEDLTGLVYSLTPKVHEEGQAWYLRPGFLGIVLLAGCVALNYIFW